MRNIANTAKKLVEDKHKDVALIEKNYQAAAIEWNKFISLQKAREVKLKDLTKTDEFEAQCEEIKIWIEEMTKKMQSEYVGNTLSVTLELNGEHERYLKEIEVMKKAVGVKSY